MDYLAEFARAVRHRDIASVVSMMFANDQLTIRSGFKSEGELWDYKLNCPHPSFSDAREWAEIAKDVLAFHNRMGGVIVFGIGDDLTFRGATHRLDSKIVNDKLRKWLSDRVWVEFHREAIQADQRYLGILLIPPRGPTLERFQGNSPEVKGRSIFRRGDSAIREGDSSKVLRKQDADALARSLAVTVLGRVYEVDEPFFRILSPEYHEFIYRDIPCRNVEAALSDPRTTVTAITGIGGVGKTALATWAVLRAYERGDFKFIVSMTAKDRELTRSGITALTPGLTSFETLLDNIVEVLGFPEVKHESTAEKERVVRELIEDSTGLLYVDNLETVDDKRIISFLDNLPVGVRAITTSRRMAVRVAVRPVELGQLTSAEVIAFISSLAGQAGFAYVADLREAEKVRIGDSCDRIPLAIRWALARANSATEALATADSITLSGRRGEELLEFVFRRVFDTMSQTEKTILEILSLFHAPLPSEAILVGAGTGFSGERILDALDQLIEDALIHRLFDQNLNDYTYTVLPITRAFVATQLAKQGTLEQQLRGRLSDYFEAKDVKDPAERLVVREFRQGKQGAETALVDLAIAAERRGDHQSAQELYDQALTRSPRSWRAARFYAEFSRHKLKNIGQALRLYEQAAANAPDRGADRALIFREWGMMLRDSGLPDATRLAIEKFEIALRETPNDVIARHALGHMYSREGHHRQVIATLEPLLQHSNPMTRKKTVPLLCIAYERTGDLVKAAQLKAFAAEQGITLHA